MFNYQFSIFNYQLPSPTVWAALLFREKSGTKSRGTAPPIDLVIITTGTVPNVI